MADLEQLLTEAAEKGLTHMTLFPVASQDGKKIYWRAQATPSTAHAYVAVSHEDPVEALTQVLKNLPSARRRKTATATVTETEIPLPPPAM